LNEVGKGFLAAPVVAVAVAIKKITHIAKI